MSHAAAPHIDIAQALRRLPLFSEITDEQLRMLVGATHERDLARGEILFQQGDPPKGFYYVIRGQIKLAFASRQGNEKVVEVLGPSQSFGEAVLFMDRNYPVFAEALADSQLLLIDRGVVFTLIEEDPHFARSLLAGMAIRLHGMVRDVEAYSLNSGAQRVVSYLMSLGDTHSPGASLPCTRPPADPITVTLPVSKHVLASRLNLVPETLSRIFHDLTERGLINVHGSEITLTDVAGLRELGD